MTKLIAADSTKRRSSNRPNFLNERCGGSLEPSLRYAMAKVTRSTVSNSVQNNRPVQCVRSSRGNKAGTQTSHRPGCHQINAAYTIRDKKTQPALSGVVIAA